MLKQNRAEEAPYKFIQLGSSKLSSPKTDIENRTPNIEVFKPAVNTYQKYSFSKSPTSCDRIPQSTIQNSKPQNSYDSYLQTIIKTNLERISAMREKHETEKNILQEQIKQLRHQNKKLKTQVFLASDEKDQRIIKVSRQLSELKKSQAAGIEGSVKQLNPEKLDQKLAERLKAECSDLSSKNYELKKANRLYQYEMSRLSKTISDLKSELQSVKNRNDQKSYREDSFSLSSSSHHLGSGRSKSRNKGETHKSMIVQPSHNSDRKLIRNLENQIRERDHNAKKKDVLIEELNDKLIEKGLSTLNNKYKWAVWA